MSVAPVSDIAWVEERFRSGTRPPESLTTSEWSNKYVYLPEEASAEPGRYSTDRTPYITEFMDCFSDPAVEEFVLIKSAQVGGTQAATNAIGHKICTDPGQIMIVCPNDKMVDRYSKQRVAPLIASTPRLRELVSDAKSRDSGNTINQKSFPGGVLVIANARSPDELRSMAVELLILDEEDAYEELPKDGHPSDIVIPRTDTFGASRKIAHISTPLVAGMSRVEEKFNASDRCFYFVPCPQCKQPQRLVMANLKHDGSNVWYECLHCKRSIEEVSKTWMLAEGAWVATAVSESLKLRGFQISSLYSPLGWRSWADLMAQFLKAKNEPSKLKSFCNLRLGETWEEKGIAPPFETLVAIAKRDGHVAGVAPREVVVVTMAVDVQGDRLEWERYGWSKGNRRASIDRGIIHGDPTTAAPWGMVDVIRSSPIARDGGGALRVSVCAIDSGEKTQEVYSYVRPRQPSVIAVKGGSPSDSILRVSQPDSREEGGRRHRRGSGVLLYTIDVSRLKKDLYAHLALVPIDGVWPEKSVRIPKPNELTGSESADYDDEYFEQLTAEKLTKVLTKGNYMKLQWAKKRERNEALDLAVYNWAAAKVLKLDRWTDQRWDQEYVRLEQPADAPAARRSGFEIAGRIG